MSGAERHDGTEASDLGRFEPSPYDLGITDNPEAARQDGREPVPYLLTPAAEAALDDGAECGADRADCRAWLADLGPEHDGALVYDVPLPRTPVQPGPYPDPSDPERLAERLGFTSAAAMCAAYEAYADDLEARAVAEPEAEP